MIAFQLRRSPELCLSISQQPPTLYGIAASPASYRDYYVTDTWSAWSWTWLAITASPLPPATTNGAGYDAPRTAAHGDQSWHPFSSTSHLICILFGAKHRLQKVCICWLPRNHACWWRLGGSGRGAGQRHGNHRWILPDLEAEAQHYKNGVGSFPPQPQGS